VTTKSKANLAIEIIRKAQRVIAEEERHRRRTLREEQAAGHRLYPGELTTTTRDKCDLALAHLVGDLTATDCERAIRFIRATIKTRGEDA
jgi:hypothetical protein